MWELYPLTGVQVASAPRFPPITPASPKVAVPAPDGTLYVAEFHPFTQVMDDGDVTEPTLFYPYFPSPEPLVFPTQGSYADPDAKVEQPVEFGWSHSMGEIVTTIAEAGLRI